MLDVEGGFCGNPASILPRVEKLLVSEQTQSMIEFEGTFKMKIKLSLL